MLRLRGGSGASSPSLPTSLGGPQSMVLRHWSPVCVLVGSPRCWSRDSSETAPSNVSAFQVCDGGWHIRTAKVAYKLGSAVNSGVGALATDLRVDEAPDACQELIVFVNHAIGWPKLGEGWSVGCGSHSSW